MSTTWSFVSIKRFVLDKPWFNNVARPRLFFRIVIVENLPVLTACTTECEYVVFTCVYLTIVAETESGIASSYSELIHDFLRFVMNSEHCAFPLFFVIVLNKYVASEEPRHVFRKRPTP